MAILERPVSQSRSERPGGDVAGPPSVSPGRSTRRRSRSGSRRWEVLPIALLGIVGAVSVGYGFGTLVQFDSDWRAGAPSLVASAEGSAAQGTPLAAAIEKLLATSTSPVSDVRCAADSVVGSADSQLCHARASTGMVSVLASGPAVALHVDVFSRG